MNTAQQEVEKLLAQIRERAKHDPVIERVSDQIEVLCKGYMADPVLDADLPPSVRGAHGKQGVFLKLLLSREGQVVTRESAMNALYFDAHDEPEDKIIDVFAFQLRKKLRDTPYKIEAVWGTGHRLVKEKDFIPPRFRSACRHGHPYDSGNTYIAKDGTRKCQVCRAAARARYSRANGKKAAA